LELCISDGVNLHYQKFCRGKYSEPLKIISPAPEKGKTGTAVKFKPDSKIFSVTEFDFGTISSRMREQAFLNAGLKITVSDMRNEPVTETFCYNGGIVSYVTWLQKQRGAENLHNDVIYINGKLDDISVEIAFQYNTDFNSESIRSFANNIHTLEGGTHENAFKKALNKVINDFVKSYKENLPTNKKKVSRNVKTKLKSSGKEPEKEYVPLSGEAVREAINAIVSVKMPECEFEGQTKSKLGSSEAYPAVYRVTAEKLTYYFEEHPETIKVIAEKAVNAQAARDAAKKAMEAKRKSATDSLGLPGKLADCYSKETEKTEIYIVEGDSAGGSAKQGRNSEFQAILALWGKMLNVEQSRVDKVYGNDKLSPVVKALGTGLGEDFDIKKLRYGRVVIMADADVDGSHIRTLLLTFFFRFMRPLLEYGHVFIAQPPLYKIFRTKHALYAFSEEERDACIAELAGENNAKVEVQRYKGLGEMDPEQLWETTMDPATRTMIQVSLDDAASADQIFSILMGDKVEPRRDFIEKNARYVTNLDI
jgi:DNA gyrase subunit B